MYSEGRERVPSGVGMHVEEKWDKLRRQSGNDWGYGLREMIVVYKSVVESVVGFGTCFVWS